MLCVVLTALFAGIAVTAALAAWRLSSGPVSLAFLTPYLEDALTPEDGDLEVEVAETVLTWAGWDRTLEIRVLDVTAVHADRGRLASIPEMVVGLSSAALLKADVAPRTIDILAPRLRVVRSADGEMEFGFGEQATTSETEDAADAEAAEDGESDDAGQIVRALAGDMMASADADRPIGYLSRLSIIDANITIVDRMLGTVWRVPTADIILDRNDEGIGADVIATLAVGGTAAEIDATAIVHGASGTIETELLFANVEPAAFAEALPQLAELGRLKLPLNGTVSAVLDKAGRPQSGTFSMTAGAGSIQVPEYYDRDIEIDELTFAGRLDRADDLLRIESLAVKIGPAKADITAELANLSGDVHFVAEATLADVPFDDLDFLWPRGVGASARTWVTQNMNDGVSTVTTARMDAVAPDGDFTALAVNAFTGTIAVEGMTVDYLTGMPPVLNARASAVFDAKTMDITLHGGTLWDLTVDEGWIRFTDLDLEDQFTEIEMVVSGPTLDALRLVDHEPLHYAEDLGIDPERVSGEQATRLSFKFPATLGLTLDGVEVMAASNLRDLKWQEALFDIDAEDGELTLQLDKSGMDVTGRARFGGMVLDIEWLENFEEDVTFRNKVILSGVVGDADRERLGLAAAPYLTGPVDAVMKMVKRDDGTATLTADLDLAAATVRFDDLHFAKPAGTAGAAQLIMQLADDRPTEISDFRFAGDGFGAAGAVAFAPAPAEAMSPAVLRFDRFLFGRNDLSGRIEFDSQGGMDVTLEGASFDAEPFLADDEDGEDEDGAGAPIRIDARFDRVHLGPDRGVDQVAVKARRVADVWQKVDLVGTVGEGTPLKVKVRPDGGVRYLLIGSDDAGAVLRAFDIADGVQGGRLAISGTFDDEADGAPLTGEAVIADFRLRDAPIIAKVLTLASFTGIRNTLTGKGIDFDEFRAEFSMVDGAIETKDALIKGSQLALTANGTVDTRADDLDLGGEIIPAYTLNNLFNQIPVLGEILGGEDSGVFAATYRVVGPVGNPKVTVNPLSALAPGLLRNLLRIEGSPQISQDPGIVEEPGETPFESDKKDGR